MIIASFLLSLPTLTGNSPILDLIEARVATEQAFAINTRTASSDGRVFMVKARRPEDAASLSVTLQLFPDQESALRLWRDSLPPSGPSEDPTPFSGLPCGDETLKSEDPGGISLTSKSGLVRIQANISGHRATRDQNGDPQYQVADREGDKVAIEGILRHSLAGAIGLGAMPMQPVQYGTSTLPAILGPMGDTLVDLVRFCDVNGISLVVNDRRGTASFVFNGNQTVIPLAARRIKDGGSWIESNDISLVRDGKWYVAFSALQTAISG